MEYLYVAGILSWGVFGLRAADGGHIWASIVCAIIAGFFFHGLLSM